MASTSCAVAVSRSSPSALGRLVKVCARSPGRGAESPSAGARSVRVPLPTLPIGNTSSKIRAIPPPGRGSLSAPAAAESRTAMSSAGAGRRGILVCRRCHRRRSPIARALVTGLRPSRYSARSCRHGVAIVLNASATGRLDDGSGRCHPRRHCRFSTLLSPSGDERWQSDEHQHRPRPSIRGPGSSGRSRPISLRWSGATPGHWRRHSWRCSGLGCLERRGGRRPLATSPCAWRSSSVW